MLRKFFLSAIAIASLCLSYAQDSTAPAKTGPTISGSADVYYRYNFANLKVAPYNNYTSFTNSHNSFELGMASVKIEHTIGKVGMVADLGFGRRAEEFSYTDGDVEAGKNGFLTLAAVKQLYLTYSPSAKVKFTFGSFGTHVGYELLDAYLNRNYSMSYGFSYGPFFHTGIKADFVLGAQSGLMFGIVNPTDLKSASGMPKMFIGQYSTGTSDDKLNLYFNFQGGKYDVESRLYQGDITGSYAFTDKFSLGLNGTYQTRSVKDASDKWSDGMGWYSAALYANVDPVSWFGFTLRGEYFNDDDGVLGFGTNIIIPTLSFNFKVDNLTIIPEFRFESAGTELYYEKGMDPTVDLPTKKSTGSFILAATYRF